MSRDRRGSSTVPAAAPAPARDGWLGTLRSVLFALYQFTLTPPYALFMLAFFWLPVRARYALARAWCGLVLFGARWICGIRHRVIGAQHIPATPCVIMCKHSSTWETLFLTQILPPLAYVAKKELLSIPFFGWAFRFAAPITINRKAGQDAMVQITAQGRERVAQGFWIVIYPEGTRIRAGTRARYKTGGARLATALALPMLPVAHDAGWLWPKGILHKRAGTVTLSIGAPIAPEGRDVAQLTQRVETWIEDEVARLGRP